MATDRIIMHTFFAVVCAIFLNKATFAEPVNLSKIKETVKVYHDSGAYQKEVAEVAHQLNEFINHRLAVNEKSNHPEKLAVVMDIDETTLSNYAHISARDFGGTSKQVDKAIQAADAPPLKPLLSLYNHAKKHGVAVFFVTGRKESLKTATITNLKRAGYRDWSGLYLRPENYQNTSIIPFKAETRKAISEKGYTVIASVGDQYSDLKGGYAEKAFKLPNPYYFIP